MTKVLIVDDKPQNLHLLEMLLASRGYEVLKAADGREALRQAREHRPDLIVTDILMPVMDGFALCRQCKSDEGLRDIPLIFYTATYTEPEDEKFALGLGADRFMVKPQEPSRIAKAVEEVLQESRNRKAAAADKPLGEEMEFFRHHNEALFRKLEKKMAELEREVIDRARAEAALRESEERYRALVSHSPDGIFLADLKGHFLSVNEAIYRTTGYSEEEMHSMSIWDIVPDKHREKHEARLARIMRGEVVDDTAEYEIAAKDGRRLLVEVRSVPYRKAGEIVGFLAIARDITERRRAEAERERLTVALEQAKSLQTVGMIASGVAHEVRTPLFAITTIVTALERRLQDRGEVREHLAHIREQTRRLSALMSDLLKLGRPIGPEEYEDCALREIVDQAIELLGESVPRVESRCVKNFPDDVIRVRGVPGRLAQVAVNLLQNAFTFSPEQATVEIGLQREAGEAVLRVRDSGPGIASELMDRLFEPFASRRKGGTGLGLAIVRQIVNVHGGTVEASNNDPPPGATFTVRLPIAGPAERAGG